MTAFGLGGVTLSAWGPRLPAVKADLDLSTATIGLIVVGVTVGALAGLVIAAPVLHWLGSRGGVSGSLLVMAMGLALMGVAVSQRSLPVLSAGLLVLGLGIGTLDVLINVEASAIERAARRTLMPRMHGAWSVGAALGSAIGAACAGLALSPAMQFIGEALVIAAVALGIAPAIPTANLMTANLTTANVTTANLMADRQPSEPPWSKVRSWLRGWTDWRLLLIGVVMLGVELGEGSANNWLTLAVKSDHDQSSAVAALFFTAFAASEALARIFGGPVVDRLGRTRTIRCTTALGVVGLLLFILAGDRWAVLAGVVLWAVGVSMGFPLGMSAAAESGPGPAARVSVVASVGYFANLAGPPAIGALADAAGLLNAMWLIVVLFLAAFAVAGSLGQRS